VDGCSWRIVVLLLPVNTMTLSQRCILFPVRRESTRCPRVSERRENLLNASHYSLLIAPPHPSSVKVGCDPRVKGHRRPHHSMQLQLSGRKVIRLQVAALCPSARSALGPSAGRLPQLQLSAHPAAGVPEPAVLPPRLHPGNVRTEDTTGGQDVDGSLLCVQCCSRTAARQLDRSITFHKLVAYMIAFHTGTASSSWRQL